MINLLPTSPAGDVRALRLKRRSIAVTTAVLVGYVLILAALAGSGWYLAGRQTSVSGQIDDLARQVGQLAEVEATLWQRDDRVRLVRQALADRPTVAQKASRLQGNAQVREWEYLPAQPQRVAVVGTTASQLEDYAQTLTESFASVVITALVRQDNGVWQMELELTGGQGE